MTKCPHCNGTGKMVVFFKAWRLWTGYIKIADIINCSYCSGSGEAQGD